MNPSREDHFKASYDLATKIISTVVCLGMLVLIVFVHNRIAGSVAILALLLGYSYSPRGYVVSGQFIVIKRLIGDVWVLLGAVREVRPAAADDFRGGIRLWGSGGLFGYYGLFSTTKLGKCTWYVTNRKHAVVMLGEWKTIVLSPDDMSGFIGAVRQAAPD